ncbi:MAG: tetratricopeptide repeat protein [Planctomycetes bacterium]|nr:tetratricopeptide repeat protein [Planctomycetota bacterium]
MAPARPDADAPEREPRWPLLLVLAAGLAAWWGAWNCGYVFDDRPAIVGNRALQAFDWWGAAFGPEHQPLANRPLACATLAFDLWCFGAGPFGPHLGNLLLHLANGLLVLLVVRAALRAPNLAGRYDVGRRTLVATAVAVLWVAHPLGGDAVVYATQRSTLLFSGCLLGALWSSLRAAGAASPSRWRALAVLAVALGMASKEDMVLAPVLLVLWQRALVAPSWQALRARRGYVVALAATWLVLAACLLLGPHNPTVGYATRTPVTAWQWLLTQAGVLVHYLRLVVWPHPLRGAYDSGVVTGAMAALLPGAVVVALLAVTVWLWRRRPWWGWLGALFFLLLAPTSSVLPIVTEIAAERRMYLPMLAVLVPLVVAGERWLRGRSLPLVVAAATIGCVVLAQGRVDAFRDEVAFWTDAYTKRDPASRSFLAGRLLSDYATALWLQGRFDDAADVLDRMVQCESLSSDDLHKYAQSLQQRGRTDEAIRVLRRLLARRPGDAALLGDLGTCLVQACDAEGADGSDPRLVEAEDVLRRALATAPQRSSVWNSLGGVLRARGRLAAAEQAFLRATELTTDRSMPYLSRAALLAQLGRGAEIAPMFQRLLQARPNDVALRFELSEFCLQQGQVPLARNVMQDVLRIEPGNRRALEQLQLLQGR